MLSSVVETSQHDFPCTSKERTIIGFSSARDARGDIDPSHVVRVCKLNQVEARRFELLSFRVVVLGAFLLRHNQDKRRRAADSRNQDAEADLLLCDQSGQKRGEEPLAANVRLAGHPNGFLVGVHKVSMLDLMLWFEALHLGKTEQIKTGRHS